MRKPTRLEDPKRCPQCGLTLPPSMFGTRRTEIGTIYLRSRCRPCEAAREASRRTPERSKAAWQKYCASHREQLRVRTAEYRRAHPEKVRAASRRSSLVTHWQRGLCDAMRGRAKKLGLPFDIDIDFLDELFRKQNGRCYWLGIPMVPSIKARDPRRPSVDRIDNAKGYTRDNVVLSCMFANLGRSVCDFETMSAFTEELRGHFASKQVA